MIGSLLKELLVGLGRFIRFRFQKLRGLEWTPAPPPTSEASPFVQPAQLAKLPDIGLAPEFQKPTKWVTHRSNVHHEHLLSDPLFQLWITTSGGHKWTHYFSIYRELFDPHRARPMRILEIGVFNGAGLRLWRSYFGHPDTVVVGIDIEPKCAQHENVAQSVHVRIGSQTDLEFLNRVVREFGPFDLIIDDGSHKSAHMITSFNHLFARGLSDTGIYLAEDLHANYWEGWRDSKKTFLDVCKELMEYMHAHYQKAGPGDFFINVASDQRMAFLEVPLITTLIREIRVFDSIVAIYKTNRPYLPYYLRM